MSHYYQEHTVYCNVSASLLTTWVGVTKPISSVLLFSGFFSLVETLISYWISRFYATGVVIALWCNTCQIWMWFNDSNSYFCTIENFAYGEINEQSFGNPHPWSFDWIATALVLFAADWTAPWVQNPLGLLPWCYIYFTEIPPNFLACFMDFMLDFLGEFCSSGDSIAG